VSEEPGEELERVASYPLASLTDIWVEYDRMTDTLYINFGKEEAEESIMTEDDIIISISRGRIVGIAITEFKKRIGEA